LVQKSLIIIIVHELSSRYRFNILNDKILFKERD